jgi:arylsulfatase A-like enzyme
VTTRPNILVLVLDSLRASSMSLYGYPKRTTPSIDRFAAASVVYDCAISPAAWTIPSHASLLTGLSVFQHGLRTMEGNRRLSPRLVTLPRALAGVGYETLAVSQNPLFTPAHGLGEGFGSFADFDVLAGASRRGRAARRLVRSRVGVARKTGQYAERLLAPATALAFVLDWISGRKTGDHPFFVLANLLAPHFPWIVPPTHLLRGRLRDLRYLTRVDFVSLKREWEFNARAATPTAAHLRTWRRLYEASITHVDATVGRFVSRAAEWPGWRNTIVVLLSDHGELLGDRDGRVGHSSPLLLHDDLVRVPLIVRHPDRATGRREARVVQTHDLFRTILDWTGTSHGTVPPAQSELPSLDHPADDRIAVSEEDYTDGHDVPGRLAALNPALAAESQPRVMRAARTRTHKYVEHDWQPAELYDLGVDPGEERNIVGLPDPAVAAQLDRLRTFLHSWESTREVFPPVEGDAAEKDVEVETRLRALGYLS